MISASGLSAMAVLTAAICEGASGAASRAVKVTSGYFAACSFANRLTAARKPWSAVGPEKTIRTFLPGADVPPLLPDDAAAELLLAAGVLLVQPVRITVAATAATATPLVNRRRRGPPRLAFERSFTSSSGCGTGERLRSGAGTPRRGQARSGVAALTSAAGGWSR